MYGVDGKLLYGIKCFNTNCKPCVRIRGEKSDRSEVKRGLRQGYGMSPAFFTIFIVLREASYVWRKRDING